MIEIKKKTIEFFKDYYNIILIFILLLSFIIRLYFLFSTIDQPVWWDEAQYAEEARRLGLDLETNDIWYYRRTIFLPVFWSLLFSIGLDEAALRFTEVLFSVLLVFATYLAAKELFNKKIALVAAFAMAFSKIILFETTRLLNSVPAAALMLFAVYYFYKGYIKENNTKYIYLFGLFAGLAMSVRFAIFLAIISFVFVYLIKEKGKFWKNKHMIGAFLLILLILSPFFILYQKNYPGGVQDFLRHYGEVGVPAKDKQPYLGISGLYQYLIAVPGNIGWFLFITFIIGLFFLLDFVIAPDLLFKETSLQKNLFLFMFMLPPFIYHGMKSLYIEERYLIGILPIIAIIAAYGLFRIYEYAKNYNKYTALIVIVILLLVGSFSQIKSSNELINSKKGSYIQVKEAAIWMKENSKPGEVIISNSIPQMQYYSDRSTYYVETKEEVLNLKPKFYVVSMYERSADAFYKYPDENKDSLKVSRVYFQDQQQQNPSLIIYEFIEKQNF